MSSCPFSFSHLSTHQCRRRRVLAHSVALRIHADALGYRSFHRIGPRGKYQLCRGYHLRYIFVLTLHVMFLCSWVLRVSRDRDSLHRAETQRVFPPVNSVREWECACEWRTTGTFVHRRESPFIGIPVICFSVDPVYRSP